MGRRMTRTLLPREASRGDERPTGRMLVANNVFGLGGERLLKSKRRMGIRKNDIHILSTGHHQQNTGPARRTDKRHLERCDIKAAVRVHTTTNTSNSVKRS
jgi:hypothetical protein